VAGSPHGRVGITARIGGLTPNGKGPRLTTRHGPRSPSAPDQQLKKKLSERPPVTRVPALTLTRSRFVLPTLPGTPAVGIARGG
jgi:hypothetical protein